jgi:hypothetical protein
LNRLILKTFKESNANAKKAMRRKQCDSKGDCKMTAKAIANRLQNDYKGAAKLLQSDCKSITKRLQRCCKVTAKRLQIDYKTTKNPAAKYAKQPQNQLQIEHKLPVALRSFCNRFAAAIYFLSKPSGRAENPSLLPLVNNS